MRRLLLVAASSLVVLSSPRGWAQAPAASAPSPTSPQPVPASEALPATAPAGAEERAAEASSAPAAPSSDGGVPGVAEGPPSGGAEAGREAHAAEGGVPPAPTPADAPTTTGATRVIEAVPPPLAISPEVDAVPATALAPRGPGAFVEGHPRQGAFLSGPGSLAFLLHHSILGGVGMLTTQMLPRVIDSVVNGDSGWIDTDARLAYLAGTLIGAGVGFGASAWWQFNHWISPWSATFGMLGSLVGGLFMAGATNMFTNDPAALSWTALIGAEIGAWLTTVIGTGDLPFNKGLLVFSGAGWAAVYTALIIAIATTAGNGGSVRASVDALLVTPALGATAMALATLKFNPSTTQIMRANVFGLGVGGAVLLLGALVLGADFASPIPYVLSAVGAIGAKTVVSLLWAEAAERPAAPQGDAAGVGGPPRTRVSVLW